MRYGFDTGYFVKYAAGTLSDQHRRALQRIAQETAVGVASAIVLYEIKKLGLRGVLDREDAEWLSETVGRACDIDRLLTGASLDEAARLSHGHGLSMADAMVLATALRNDAARLYTTDSDLLAFDGPIEIVQI